MELQYSSKATYWYPQMCCRLNIVWWRLHYVSNFWMGACYVRVHIRQIVWSMHSQTLHYSVWIHNELTNIVSLCSNRSLNPLCYWKAARMQYISCPTVWLGVENGFGIENEFFIGNWISINLFEFVQSVGWKVR